MRIALATCRRLPEPDPDEKPLLAALEALGADVGTLAWDDPRADAGAFDLCVLRSTWNYVHHLPEFLAWTRRTSNRTRLLNPASIVRWNVDKRYLARFAARGLRTVPTAYVRKGAPGRLRDLLGRRGWTDVVVKPRVGAGSFMTKRFPGASADAEAFLHAACAERDMMVQPYVRSVERYGERSIIALSGTLTHSIRKSPRLHGQHEKVSEATRISADERRFAEKALGLLGKPPLYARIDVARDDRGEPMLMEFELIEPSLFLIQEPKALKRFAREIVRAAGA
ncbi:MAG: hypothetical protein HY078_05005 [Elusimicrobia bacterium]|nr:hypothetical protein [Elusimicrobiota bacterium]